MEVLGVSNKNWQFYDMVINGLPQRVKYNEDTVNSLFIPLLQKLTDIQQCEQRRIMAFLAAPPATGKSTLLQFLEQLSHEQAGTQAVQALGMDGFHYPNAYLESHTIERDGKNITLRSIKGAPETFDVAGLKAKIQEAKQGKSLWPIYDRKLHNPIPDALVVNSNILLVEGNWLLLNEPQWRDLHELADYTLSIKATPELLKDRLIQRKIQGGLSEKDAVNFYETSDRLNVERILNNQVPADEQWQMFADGGFIKC